MQALRLLAISTSLQPHEENSSEGITFIMVVDSHLQKIKAYYDLMNQLTQLEAKDSYEKDKRQLNLILAELKEIFVYVQTEIRFDHSKFFKKKELNESFQEIERILKDIIKDLSNSSQKNYSPSELFSKLGRLYAKYKSLKLTL
jgi:hypothetical protein